MFSMERMHRALKSGSTGFTRLASFPVLFDLTDLMIFFKNLDTSVRAARELTSQYNDLNRSQESVESLMCYLGTEDSFTPCHKDLCASSGQNIMCYTEEGGSSFWFMTASADAPKAGEYFQSHLKLELDWEDHAATIEEFSRATFRVYVAEQKLGDLVLVPPRSCHQVVNHGGLTVKTSWSRMTIAGLRAALHHELPIYRR